MESLRELYRTGAGPSSSHTMGPQRAALMFRKKYAHASVFRVTLYGSLAATGRGHLTDVALTNALYPHGVEIIWQPNTVLPFHPNGMQFEALDADKKRLGDWQVFSVGGGALREEGAPAAPSVYKLSTMRQILDWCEKNNAPLWKLVETTEGPDIWAHLKNAWAGMEMALSRGMAAEGNLPGGLKLKRKARNVLFTAQRLEGEPQRSSLLSAYALAVMEENASAGIVVTAPTCGACGIVPAVLKYWQTAKNCSEDEILKALATAGIIGNLVKTNASISGAEVGCQGEVGTACAMAAAAAAQLLGGTPRQIEYAAEMGLEHHLGLTCDPVLGLVQIPCIERNVFAATRAVHAAEYAMLSDGSHRVPFDEIVKAMKESGAALPSSLRETSQGGLARLYAQAASTPARW